MTRILEQPGLPHRRRRPHRRHGRRHITLHLPEPWHREREWLALFAAACDPSAAAA
jgi:hypothetical protein